MRYYLLVFSSMHICHVYAHAEESWPAHKKKVQHVAHEGRQRRARERRERGEREGSRAPGPQPLESTVCAHGRFRCVIFV